MIKLDVGQCLNSFWHMSGKIKLVILQTVFK